MQIISATRPWSDETISFSTLSFVYFPKETFGSKKSPHIVLATISKDDSPFKISQFFKTLSKIVLNKDSRKKYKEQNGHFQFVLTNATSAFFPVTWFKLIFDNGIEITHNFAFSTTLIRKNTLIQTFGKFPMVYERRLPLYRSLKVKRNVYKFISSQVLK